jgi:heme/copper-type cytochrome/quinol oxidase subunit 2
MDIQTPRIDGLKKEVYQYSEKSKIPFQLEDIWYSNKIYVVVPIIILVLLCIIRPDFLYNESTDKKGNTDKKFSFQKLLSFWLFFSTILVVGIFGYRYKHNK